MTSTTSTAWGSIHAVHLDGTQAAARRGTSSTGATMSRYLIRRIEDHPAIVLHTYTEIVALEGAGRLERVRWRDTKSAISFVRQPLHE